MDDIRQALKEAIEDVLEKMFFVRMPGDGEEPPVVDGIELEAQLRFEGEPGGALALRITAEAARSIAADFLGTEENELDEQQIGEVVCELANMICGSLLSRLESEATFRLWSPEVVTTPAAETAEPEGAYQAVHAAPVGNGTLTVRVTTERPVCLLPERRVS